MADTEAEVEALVLPVVLALLQGELEPEGDVVPVMLPEVDGLPDGELLTD